MGTISIVIGLVSTLMPETLNENLPQTIEEGNEFGKNQKYFSWAKYALLFLSPKLLKTFKKIILFHLFRTKQISPILIQSDNEVKQNIVMKNVEDFD
jgi:hypothetical protein